MSASFVAAKPDNCLYYWRKACLTGAKDAGARASGELRDKGRMPSARMISLLVPMLQLALRPTWPAPDASIRLELNAAENVQSRCRLSFLIENKSASTLESLRLDLAVFDTEGVIARRLVTEMGPVLRAKTVLKAFEIDVACARIGSVLVNDVTACSPGDPDLCLDQLVLASKVSNVRFYK